MDLFGNEEIKVDVNAKKVLNEAAVRAHHKLIQLYGKKDGEKCKNCALLCYTGNTKRFYKCSLFKTSSSASSDWRVNWGACGKFEPEIIKE